jgi:hypothetical protein
MLLLELSALPPGLASAAVAEPAPSASPMSGSRIDLRHHACQARVVLTLVP